MDTPLILIILLAVILFLVYRSLPFIFLILAARKYDAGNMEETLKLYEKASGFKHSTLNIRMTYGYLLLKQGHLDEAEEILKAVENQNLKHNDKMNLDLNLSLVHWKKGDLDRAIEMLTELYTSGYKTTTLYQNLGYYLILKGDFAEALKINQEAYAYNVDSPEVIDNLAINYYFTEEYDKALELYNKIMPMKPAFVTAYYYYGKTLVQLGKQDEAMQAFNDALNCNFSFLSSVSRDKVEAEIEKLRIKEDKKLSI
jgi:tetratricopeptide (TPR) repeat protein